MDYEKAYKNLVAKVKNAHLFAQTDSTKNVLEDILPELRESEDERVIRTLYYLVRDHDWLNGATKGEALAWLEKQKESLHIPETCKENADSFTSEDERIREWLIDYFGSIKETVWIHRDITCEQILEYLEKQKEPDLTEEVKKWKKDFDSLCKEHYGQKSSVWESPIMTNEMIMDEQKEQEHICDSTQYEEGFKTGLEIGLRKQKPADDKSFEEWIDGWFKEHKEKAYPQITMDEKEFKNFCRGIRNMYEQKPEWSERDEKILASAMSHIADSQCFDHFHDISKDDIYAWLKSIRPSWKPSEEQMNCLCAAVDAAIRKHNESVSGYKPARVLKSLYEDLKKL